MPIGATFALIKQADQGVTNALSELMFTSNRDDATSRALVDDGLLVVVMRVLKQFPATHPAWLDDTAADHPEYWDAFDVLTNLAKWPSVRQDLIQAGTVDFLGQLAKLDNYFGFEATEGLAYIVGRDEDGAHSELLKARKGNVDKIIQVLDSCLNGSGTYFGMGFSVYGRVLALQCLALSDANKPLLVSAVPLMVQVITGYSAVECRELALRCLLDLTFNKECMARIMEKKEELETALSQVDAEGEPNVYKNGKSLLFRMNESTRKVNDSSDLSKEKYAMISYNWQHQALVLHLVPLLKQAGLKVWLDVEAMQGDTIEKMAEAVENCTVFILCMSEQYKESGNCRLEAQYAHQNRKPILPLLMDASYRPSGWLGILAGTKLYYLASSTEQIDSNVSKISADCFNLMKEAPPKLAGVVAGATGLSHQHLASKAPAAAAAVASSPKSTSSFPGEKITSMTPEQVEAFFKTQCGLPKLAPYVKKYGANGKTLAMIYDIHQRGGPAYHALEGLGIKKTVDQLEVLFQLKRLCEQ